MTTNTAAIRNLCAQMLAECDALDAQTCDGNQNPAPSVFDCLAGTQPPATSMYPDELNEASWLSKRSAYRTAMKNAASGSIILIGDSMIERMDASQIAPNAVNLGISGESIRQLLYRINETDADGNLGLIRRAGAVVFLTGVNDLSDGRNGSAQNAADTVKIMISRLVGWTSGRVVLCKIVPVDAGVFSVPSNSAIASVNQHIDTFASLPHVRIVDANATLAPSGSLLPQHHVDGQHLSPHTSGNGYAVLYPKIKDALDSFS